MFSILNSMFRKSTGTQHWNAPQNWHDRQHMSTYERQRLEEERNRMFLIRDRNNYR